jgi:hypothetical protein
MRKLRGSGLYYSGSLFCSDERDEGICRCRYLLLYKMKWICLHAYEWLL